MRHPDAIDKEDLIQKSVEVVEAYITLDQLRNYPSGPELENAWKVLDLEVQRLKETLGIRL